MRAAPRRAGSRKGAPAPPHARPGPFPDLDSALMAILAEWNSSRDYHTRVANISGTGSGPRLNGFSFLQANITVFSDGVDDLLIGGAGRDWYLAEVGEDHIIGARRNEVITDVDQLIDALDAPTP